MSNTIGDETSGGLKIKAGWVTVSYRVLIILMLGSAILWSDNHNDGRYVRQEDYLKDRASDRELRETKDGEIKRQLDEQREFLKSIAADVKTLLGERRRE